MYLDGDEVYRQAAYKVDAVDTTAAGDTFTGYFISQIISGKSPAEGLRLAAKASALAVTRPGALDSIPAMEEVLKEK
jgi:ribokinase